jgi:hypothetical protein
MDTSRSVIASGRLFVVERPSLRRYIKVDSVGIQASRTNKYVGHAKLHQVVFGNGNLQLPRAEEPGALRNIIPEDHSIGPEMCSIHNQGTGNTVHRHARRSEFH